MEKKKQIIEKVGNKQRRLWLCFDEIETNYTAIIKTK